MKRFEITSYDTFSTVDGPGIRTVIFLHGCPNRCVYCHNPECFVASQRRYLSFDELEEIWSRNAPYYGQEGGLTFSGGEPLLQAEAINEFYDRTHCRYVVETSGSVCNGAVFQALERAQTVFLDFKFPTAEDYEKYVGPTYENTVATLDHIEEEGINHLIRQVVVPTINDDLTSMCAYLDFIGARFRSREVQFLPFHDMMKEKYRRLQLEYKLNDIHSLDKLWLRQRVEQLRVLYPHFKLS